MSDLGPLAYFLGIESVRTTRGKVMHQKKYTSDVLKRFNMFECNSSATLVENGNTLCNEKQEDQAVDFILYRQMIGSLSYICNSRPDITYGVGLVSKFMEEPKHSYMMVLKTLFRYFKGSLDNKCSSLLTVTRSQKQCMNILMQIGVVTRMIEKAPLVTCLSLVKPL
ncbi:PREDICTED: uncharacterized protein LOC109328117 [Lupinus angustifolius]|uniref:uncharacterized protein LOC109328117 n=1 Tax=Lupinus angustifolius TaxID=3871 RepID=UPI00092F9C3B|nr:PREDICTED: uncharacterized protein LOC109328117 [Lupinus angustifolius]